MTAVSISYACDCIPTPSPEEAYARASEIFNGTVFSIRKAETTASASPWMPAVVTFLVTRVWKGTGVKEIFTDMGSTCGYHFKEKDTYLVYANDREGMAQTNICTRTKLLQDSQEDIEYLIARDISR